MQGFGGHGANAPLPTLRFQRYVLSKPHAYLPWQCLYFLPLPQGQSSLRPTLPQLAGFLGSWSAAAVAGTSDALANAISSSPVFGSSLCASIAGNGHCSSGGTISTRINCAV